MFQKGNKVYAEVGNYLRHKTLRIIGLSVVGNIEDYEEHPLNDPLDIKVENGNIYFNNRMFLCVPEKMDYVGIKTKVIKSRYSNDDQIALMLNEAQSEEDKVYFSKMQAWRDWAGWFAKEVVAIIEEQNKVTNE